MPREIAYNWLDRAAGQSALTAEEALFVMRLQANEDAAYDELVRTYSASIFHVAYRMLGDTAEASDIVQEIFLKVFRNIGGFKGDDQPGGVGSGPARGVVALTPTPEQALQSKEEETAIQQALGKLSREHRSIIVLRDIEGFSYNEIADVLGVSIGTVKSRLARARGDLKKSLMRYLSVQQLRLLQ
jgi:RNA polymerase sigma-70 factor (ECF subfamily)